MFISQATHSNAAAVRRAEAEPPKPETGNAPVPQDEFATHEEDDPGLMPKSTFWSDVGTGAGVGALLGAIVPGVVIPFFGLALAPFTMPVGAAIGAAVAGACSGHFENEQAG